jgi:putative molybdopterin biosynthesis protein
MAAQSQFLDVIDRDEAERRFHAALALAPLGQELVPLCDALGRVLAQNVTAPLDVPSFDRSNVDGFAVQAADTFAAREEAPRRIQLLDEAIAPGKVPSVELVRATAVPIATGAMLPRGADAVVMVEHADIDGSTLLVRRAVTPGAHVSFAGTDIAAGETVLRRGEVLTSRETGVLAAIGIAQVSVWRRPRVGIVSTGDELVPPGQSMRPGLVFDSNARILADAVREAGGQPAELGIVGDDIQQLRESVDQALVACDMVLLSGGTSKGAGDLTFRLASQWHDPGVIVHGVAVKPGKPICLAATRGKPIAILPGFPTSAIFTFHEFVAPVIRRLAGLPAQATATVTAQLAVKVNSEIGRTEYLLVGLADVTDEAPATGARYAAFPMGRGSGSVTTFSRADGFVVIGRHEEIVPAGTLVEVHLLGRDVHPPDLIVMGSHCIGLDYLLSQFHERGDRAKFLAIGSTAGLDAVQRGECDVAGIHLLDAATQQYNRPFLPPGVELVDGYGRMQGIVFRRGDERFEGRTPASALAAVQGDPRCLMVNRNQGSGTRMLIDQILAGARPAGYAVQPRSHNAVVAAVRQGRADWGVAIETAARHAGLGFLPLCEERYDFAVAQGRLNRSAVQKFVSLLADAGIRRGLAQLGFKA